MVDGQARHLSENLKSCIIAIIDLFTEKQVIIIQYNQIYIYYQNREQLEWIPNGIPWWWRWPQQLNVPWHPVIMAFFYCMFQLMLFNEFDENQQLTCGTIISNACNFVLSQNLTFHIVPQQGANISCIHAAMAILHKMCDVENSMEHILLQQLFLNKIFCEQKRIWTFFICVKNSNNQQKRIYSLTISMLYAMSQCFV